MKLIGVGVGSALVALAFAHPAIHDGLTVGIGFLGLGLVVSAIMFALDEESRS